MSKSRHTKDKGSSKHKESTDKKKKAEEEEDLDGTKTNEELFKEFGRRQKRVIEYNNNIENLQRELDQIGKETNTTINKVLAGDISLRSSVNDLIGRKKKCLASLKSENIKLIKTLVTWNQVYFELVKRSVNTENEAERNSIMEYILEAELVKKLVGDDLNENDDISLRHVEVEEEIDRKVSRSRYRGLVVAQKTVVIEESKLDKFKENVRKLATTTYPAVAKHYGFYENPLKRTLALIVEWQDLNLQQFLHAGKFFVGEKKKFEILKEIINGLSYLLKIKLFHLNLKSSNILLDRNFGVKFTDFRITLDHNNASPNDAPELAGRIEYNDEDYSADLYSLGLLIWEIFHMKIPDGPKEWNVQDPKYDKLKHLYETLTIHDRSARIEALKNHYSIIVDGDVSFNKISDLLEEVESNVLAPPSTVEHVVWEKATSELESKDSALWNQFVDHFKKYYSVTLSNAEGDKTTPCLKEILGARANSWISRTNWERFNSFFASYIKKNINEFVQKLVLLYEAKYFHGFLSLEDATGKLHTINESSKKDAPKKKKLHYLVRLDEARKGHIFLSFLKDDQVIETEIPFPPTDSIDKVMSKIEEKIRKIKETNPGHKISVTPGPYEFIFSQNQASHTAYVSSFSL